MPTNIALQLGTATEIIAINHAVIAGWTGRDPEAVEKHISELEKLGVKRPSTTPIYYRVAASRVSTKDTIEVTGTTSSGEVEFVLLQTGGKLWVGVGSDHTDREVESYDVTVSKQICEKPIAVTFWDFEDVHPHWDQLTLRAHIEENGTRTLYQEGGVTAICEPLELISKYASELTEGTIMFCGTFAAKGGVRPSETFEIELNDPVLNRTIAHKYRTVNLPRVS